MEIPTTGRDVLFVLQPARPEDKQPAVIRPAKIISIWSYGPKRAVVNLSVILDGDRDASLASKLTMGTNCRVSDDMMFLYFTSSQYDPKLSTPGTWCYDAMEINFIEEVTVDLEITHGREIIRAGAVGIWDEGKDTITFDRNDITGIADDQLPTYPFSKFFDQHIARLTLPGGFMIGVGLRPSDGTESPEERKFVIGDIMRMNNDRRYLENRKAGMPAPSAGSIIEASRRQKSRELAGQMETGREDSKLPLQLSEDGSKATSGNDAGNRDAAPSDRLERASA